MAAGNPCLEAGHAATGSDLSRHKALTACLGMPLGELWAVGALAADCARDGVHECFLTSAPLHVGDGVDIRANAIAVK